MHSIYTSDFLKLNRAPILGRWKKLVMDTYPAEASGFFNREKDRFANPVGIIIEETVSAMYDEIAAGIDAEKFAAVIEEMVKVRAVQSFCASDAVRFIFLLKKAILEEIEKHGYALTPLAEFAAMEGRIDEAVLLVFESYTHCRERLSELKTREIQRRNYRAMSEAN